MTTMLAKVGATVAVSLLLATTACGGASRPSSGEISATLQKGVSTDGGSDVKLTEQQSDCAARVFLASGLSDEALQALADGDRDYKSSDKDEAALDKVRPQLAKCATG